MAEATETTVETVEQKPSRTYTAEEFKELIAQRDAVKAKLREREEADKKALDAKLLEEGKLKEALEAKDRELSELKGVKDRLATFEAAEAARKEKLLKSLPEKKRELYADVSIAVLEDIVNDITEKPPKAPKAGSTEGVTTFRDMTELERQELKKANPHKWWEEFSNYWHEKNGGSPPLSLKPKG